MRFLAAPRFALMKPDAHPEVPVAASPGSEGLREQNRRPFVGFRVLHLHTEARSPNFLNLGRVRLVQLRLMNMPRPDSLSLSADLALDSPKTPKVPLTQIFPNPKHQKPLGARARAENPNPHTPQNPKTPTPKILPLLRTCMRKS